ncbi:MAG: aminotransferase class I/II-fold pyridoxal phosphate-dependent enzyme, partial [Planctomycetaceae bacterium]|nr:aminotransferase class I/II-fold pyridoxal phosphate-dependent enzyme [Planctomycetaceae bacterium]
MMSWFRPHILKLAGYVPGEQPQGVGFIKLNTTENPYPPSPRVLEALANAVSDRLRLYPDPLATDFRHVVAAHHGVEPDMILAGNGSDDLLTIITRAFVGPGDLAAYPTPSYLLYSTLIRLQDGREHLVPFNADWTLHPELLTSRELKLVFLANPNSPSGTALSPDQVAELARAVCCPLVVDEAYVDFADDHCIGLVLNHPNVIVTRSFSKGYSLAGIRLGYLVAHPRIVT